MTASDRIRSESVESFKRGEVLNFFRSSLNRTCSIVHIVCNLADYTTPVLPSMMEPLSPWFATVFCRRWGLFSSSILKLLESNIAFWKKNLEPPSIFRRHFPPVFGVTYLPPSPNDYVLNRYIVRPFENENTEEKKKYSFGKIAEENERQRSSIITIYNK